MSHTKGRWHPVARMIEIERSDKPDICTLDPELFGQGHLKRSDAETWANAHLIAAAPDLLSAAKRVLSVMDRSATGSDECPAAFDALRNAVADATYPYPAKAKRQ